MRDTLRILLRSYATVCVVISGLISSTAPAEDAKSVVPVALLPFQERGDNIETLGGKVTDLLFAQLVARDDMVLVERQDLDKVLQEQELSAAGFTDPAHSAVVGRLTGAKVLIAGSVLQVGDNLYLVAKLIGVETSRVVGASAKGKATGDVDELVAELGGEVAAKIQRQASELVAKSATRQDRVAELAKAMKNAKRPAMWIEVQERHIGQSTIDPAAETELAALCAELGFRVIDRTRGVKSEADVLLQGEGVSQFAARHGGLVSVKARLELKAIERDTARVLAVDRQTSIAVDAAELIASKSALQDAAAELATRLLPKVVSGR